MNDLYPLKFKPIFKEKIWGGNKIQTVFGMDYSPLPNCGEAWVLSGYGDEISTVTNGFLAENQLDELIEVYMGAAAGTEQTDELTATDIEIDWGQRVNNPFSTHKTLACPFDF